MNADTVKGRWKQWMGRAKQAWSHVTHNELLEAEGQMLHVSGLLQQRCGEVRAEAERLLSQVSTPRERAH